MKSSKLTKVVGTIDCIGYRSIIKIGEKSLEKRQQNLLLCVTSKKLTTAYTHIQMTSSKRQSLVTMSGTSPSLDKIFTAAQYQRLASYFIFLTGKKIRSAGYDSRKKRRFERDVRAVKIYEIRNHARHNNPENCASRLLRHNFRDATTRTVLRSDFYPEKISGNETPSRGVYFTKLTITMVHIGKRPSRFVLIRRAYTRGVAVRRHVTLGDYANGPPPTSASRPSTENEPPLLSRSFSLPSSFPETNLRDRSKDFRDRDADGVCAERKKDHSAIARAGDAFEHASRFDCFVLS